MTVYWLLARVAKLVKKAGFSWTGTPVEFYRNRKFYVMRTDAHDRFRTRLERRLTKPQIENMLAASDFRDIRGSDRAPCWCAAGIKR